MYFIGMLWISNIPLCFLLKFKRTARNNLKKVNDMYKQFIFHY